ncbi:MAG: ABC transporter permease [Gammaproteobacteria bacterium]|nr:ABC transporter permease [Gammaproteobacteria bacterium]
MFSRMKSLILKDFIQFARDKTILGVIFWMYTIEVVICGYAMTFEVKDLPVGVIDYDQSVASRDLLDRFALSEAFTLAGYAKSEEQAESWMREGRAKYVLVVPRNFERDLRNGDSPSVQVLLDGTNSNAASLAKDYTAQILRTFEADYRSEQTYATAVRPVVQVWYNRTQTLESFVVLSMIVAATTMIGAIHPAASIMREKEVGTIDQLMVTPTRVWEIFVAKTIPTVVVGLVAFFPSLVIVWWFGIPIRGSLLLYLALTAVFLVSAIAIGVMLASITRTLQQTLLLCFFGLFPMLFLSGTMTPIESMPAFMQPFTYLSPARYYMDINLGIFLKGNGIVELWPQALSMAGIGLVLYLLAGWRFKHNLG